MEKKFLKGDLGESEYDKDEEFIFKWNAKIIIVLHRIQYFLWYNKAVDIHLYILWHVKLRWPPDDGRTLCFYEFTAYQKQYTF